MVIKKGVSAVSALLLAAGMFSAAEAKEGVYGKAKSYYIDTTKKSGAQTDVDASALAAGGQIGYAKAFGMGLSVAATAMGTYGIGNSGNEEEVDRSVLAGGYNGDDDVSVLGEAYLRYENGVHSLTVGRQVLNTPLAAAKEVRMLPTTFEAALYSGNILDATMVQAGHITSIKQRNSDTFYSMGKNAFGDQTETITGQKNSGVSLVSVIYNGVDGVSLQAWDYYAHDILNAVYLQGDLNGEIGGGLQGYAALQYLKEGSVGGMDRYLKDSGVDGIDAVMTGVKAGLSISRLSLGVAMTRTGKNSQAHDDVVAPWDGTPAFTNMITSNNLEKSQMGAALGADGPYRADTQAYRLETKYLFPGKIRLMAAYATYEQGSEGSVPQKDFNLKLSVPLRGVEITGIGIWVSDSGGIDKKSLEQYRVIAAYPF